MTYKFVAPYIKEIVPYPPGKPIEEVERELGISNSIKIASNENPLGPSPVAVKAIRKALKGINRYPDGSCFYLKNKLSDMLKIDAQSLIIGNGSNELIELIIRTFLKPDDEAIISDPSFLIYSLTVKSAGGKPIMVKLLKDFSYDIDGIINTINSKTRLIFISNPNNPTGTIIKSNDYERLINGVPEHTIIVDDEAYMEFVEDKDYPDGVEYVKQKDRNIIVLRTFSKLYGLAGLRVGYGITTKELADYIERVRQPFNVNNIAQVGALASLEDREHVKKTLRNNHSGLAYLYKELDKLGIVYFKTQANFFLINVSPYMKAVDAFKALLKRGIIVRDMTGYGLGDYIRINVGKPKENKKFIVELRNLINSHE
ncbi:MAG: histidinol-phosphate transaminase [Deltaproteobacteria bacterium]|nr:histidinol-phosphate transaminase [Deltaproteobacteria bacterium]